ncbi:C40 family peptidase [Streptacidiphilus fuscans]|uniref:C40 family peptidase n=1 Tax=Streptacidiphilus fuscans TaxID=2789292 RepID=A0A931B8N1_9ACTN|nr:C40 family peptidase [Streptacidiphilus fuscans]MBF9071056.1 C40 family peptidase [Streptacidiphilus fuscans]
MANHRRPRQTSRARVSVLTAAAATVVALSAQTAAQAAPTVSVKDAQTQVDADRQDASVKTEQYDNAHQQQQNLQQKVAVIQAEIARQQAQINNELGQLGQIANAQYASGEIDPTVQLLLSSDPQHFLDQATSQDELTANQTSELSQLVAQEATLNREKAQAASELAQEQALLSQMSSAKSEALAKLAHAQSILNTLTAAEQAAVNNANNGGGYGSGGSTSNWNGTIDLSGISPTARTAMLAAEQWIGKTPYLWGGSTPSGFDCSGLVMWAYGQAGVSLPHSSYADESVGTAVPSLADAMPGDIIVMEGGGHVGLYAGNNMLLNAPEYGYDVSVQPMSYFGGIVAIRRM